MTLVLYIPLAGTITVGLHSHIMYSTLDISCVFIVLVVIHFAKELNGLRLNSVLNPWLKILWGFVFVPSSLSFAVDVHVLCFLWKHMYTQQFKVSPLNAWQCLIYIGAHCIIAGQCVAAVYWERLLVRSCICYDWGLTFDLLSKYWIRSCIHKGLIGVSHEALSHHNPQLKGGDCTPPGCVRVIVCRRLCMSVCCGVDVWMCYWVSVTCVTIMSLYKLSTWLVCAFVASMLVCVLYLCPTLVPFTVIPVPHSRAEPIYSVIHKPGDNKVPQALYRGFCPSPAPLYQGPLPFSSRY